MESNNKLKASKIFLIVAIIVLLGLIVFWALTQTGNEESNADEIEVSEVKGEVISNTSDIQKLKSSEYTSAGFDNLQIGDSFDVVESNIGDLEEITDSNSKYDTYYYNDEQLGSNYIFYFDNNELKEISVFLT